MGGTCYVDLTGGVRPKGHFFSPDSLTKCIVDENYSLDEGIFPIEVLRQGYTLETLKSGVLGRI